MYGSGSVWTWFVTTVPLSWAMADRLERTETPTKQGKRLQGKSATAPYVRDHVRVPVNIWTLVPQSIACRRPIVIGLPGAGPLPTRGR